MKSYPSIVTTIDSILVAITENLEDEDQMPISIPIEMEIEVTILDNVDEDELYLDTRTLLGHLDLTKVKEVKGDDKGGDIERTESKIFKRARKGYEFRGVDITASERMLTDPGMCVSLGY